MKNIQIVKSLSFSIATVVATLGGAPVMAQTFESLDEQAGYSIGVNIGLGLSSEGLDEDLDIEALIAGIRDSLSDDGNLQLSQDEMMSAIQRFTTQQEEKMQAQRDAEAAEQANFLTENAQREEVMTTESGLQYMVMEEGDSNRSPEPSDTVNVHYHGTLIDGTVFDSSVQRGEPISFPLDGVIEGWTEGLQLMDVGDKYRFFIPSDLAYGPQGAGGVIGPNATLIFEVELLGIEDENTESSESGE